MYTLANMVTKTQMYLFTYTNVQPTTEMFSRSSTNIWRSMIYDKQFAV